MKLCLALLILLTLSTVGRAGDLPFQVLVEINLARTAPQEYAELMQSQLATYQGREGHRAVDEAVRFLKRTSPLPPLDFSPGLSQAALLHVNKQGPGGGRGHGNPWSRMDLFGQRSGSSGENIHYGVRTARHIVFALVVDDGLRSRAHRKNLMSRSFGVVGVASGTHRKYGAMCVMDFASSFHEAGRIAASQSGRGTLLD